MKPGRSAAVREAGRVAAWSAALYAGVSVVATLLAQHRAGSLAVQAFAAEWGAGRLGVAWSDPAAPVPTTRAVLGRLGRGVLLGLAVAIGALALAGVTRAATFSHWGLAPSPLALGLVVAILGAIRDELLLRGLVLRVFRHTLPVNVTLLVCGAIAAAARVGELRDETIAALLVSPTGLASLAVAALGGICLATLWVREGGAFRACGAHAAWTFVTTALVSGGACDATWSGTAWGGGSVDASLATVTALSLATAAALLVHARWYGARRGTG